MNKLEEVFDLREKWGQLTEKRDCLEKEEEWFPHWQQPDIAPSMYVSKTTPFEMGTAGVANFESFKEELSKLDDVYIEEVDYAPKQVYFSYVVLNKSATAIEEITGKYGFNKETCPYEQNPKEKLQETKQQLFTVHKC